MQTAVPVATTTSTTDDPILELGRFFAVLWQGKWLIAVVMVLSMLAAGTYAYRVATPMYRAKAVVLMQAQQSPLAEFQSTLSGFTSEASDVASELEVIRARGLISDVARELDLINDPEFNAALRPLGHLDLAKLWLRENVGVAAALDPSPDAISTRELNRVVDVLRQRLNARVLPNSHVIEVTFLSNDPVKAARIANAVVNRYTDRQIGLKFDALQQAIGWLSLRVNELQAQLEAAERARAEFSAATDLVSVEELHLLERQLKDLRDRAADQMGRIATEEAQITALEKTQDPILQVQMADDAMLTRLANDTRVGADAALYQDRLQVVLDQRHMALEQARTLQSNLSTSARTLAARIEAQNADLITLQQLDREAESIRLLYETFLTRLNETRAQQGVQLPDSVVLSAAIVPEFAASPRKGIIIALAAFAGLLLGGVLVFWHQARRPGFLSIRDVEETAGLPVLAQLAPHADLRDGATPEPLRDLRTHLLFPPSGPAGGVILVASVGEDAQPDIPLGLAATMAAAGKKTLLIETTQPNHTSQQALPSQGLASVVLGESTLCDAIQHQAGSDFAILTGQSAGMHIADLLSSKGFEEIISDARKRYDIILVAGPAVRSTASVRIIAGLADTSVLCVDLDRTRATDLAAAVRQLDSQTNAIAGLVVTNARSRKKQRTTAPVGQVAPVTA